jgi:hypothetical protein
MLLVALGGMVAGARFVLFPRIEELQAKEIEDELRLGARVLQDLERQEQRGLMQKLQELAARPALRDLLAQRPAEEAAREGWLSSLRAEVAALTAALRDFPVQDLFVLDATGTGLARNIDMHWTGQPPSDHPAVLEMVQGALKGEPRIGSLVMRERALRVAAVPIGNGQAQGALLLQALIDDQAARRLGEKLPLEMDAAVVFGGGVAAGTSLAEDKVEWFQRALREGPFAQWLSSRAGPEAAVFSFGPEDRLRAAAIRSAGEPTLVAIRDLQSLRQPFAEYLLWTAALAGAAWLALSLLLLIFGGRIYRAAAALERDALAVLHGEKPAVAPRGPALIRSLGEIFNQLREKPAGAPAPAADAPKEDAQPPADSGSQDATEKVQPVPAGEASIGAEDLPAPAEKTRDAFADLPDETGSPDEPASRADAGSGGKERPAPLAEPAELEGEGEGAPPSEKEALSSRDGEESKGGGDEDDEDDDEEKTREVQAFSVGGSPEPPPPPEPEPEPLAAPADDDLKAVYQEFVRAKESLGEHVEKLNYERFRRKLLREREALVARHGCRTVNFEVVIRSGQVSLRPRIVR